MSALEPDAAIAAAPTRLRLIPRPATEAPAPADNRFSGLLWARQYRAKLQVTDVSVVVIASTLASLAGLGATTTGASGLTSLDQWGVSVIVVLAWVAALGAFRTRDSRVVGIGAREYRQVINASAVAFGMLAILFLLLDVHIARGHFLLALPLGVAGLILERWLWRRWLLRQRKFGHYLARAIVVGRREDVGYVVRQIGEKSGAAYRVVGVALEEGGTGAVRSDDGDVPVVTDFTTVAHAAARLGVDTVIVAGQPTGGGEFIRNLGWDLENTATDLVLSSRLTDVAGPRIHFRPVEGLPLIHVEIPRFEGARHTLKRTLDVVVSACALLMLLPLLLVIAALIKLDGPGPVLFTQDRCGRGGRTFRMVKFRSMVATAEDDLAGLLDRNEASGVLFKIRNDPRITPIGRVLRKYSLDELPQLWNILVGDMSLVGPRPPLPQEVESYESHVHRRLYIKPGLTGMWQVNGRSDLSWDDSVRLDLYYVENWSLTGDLIIIWRTFKTIARPTGAY